MRIPDAIKRCVAFLAVNVGGAEHSRKFACCGTAFFVRVKAERMEGARFLYVVTARHVAENAKSHGDLYLRLNTRDCQHIYSQITGNWIVPEDPMIDLAVLPMFFDEDLEVSPLEEASFATEEVARDCDVGIGDEVVIPGLFVRRHGRQRNIPILRTGSIAAMPEEPLEDKQGEFDAYLIESRSIGGLSGSPVLVVKTPGRIESGHVIFDWRLRLLGIIRGHWDRGDEEIADFAKIGDAQVNMGIAIVTPVQKLLDLLYRADVLSRRRQVESEEAKRLGIRLDSVGTGTQETIN